jgi:hypothetical protein
MIKAIIEHLLNIFWPVHDNKVDGEYRQLKGLQYSFMLYQKFGADMDVRGG